MTALRHAVDVAEVAASDALPADPRVQRSKRLITWLSLLVVGAVVVSVWWGTDSIHLGPVEAWRAFLNDDDASRLATIAVDARLSRVLMALLVGGALAASGVLLQALFRNPLGAPEVTGVTQGSLVAVILWLVWGGGDPSAPTWFLPAIGMAGGVLTGMLTYAVSRLGGRTSPLRLLLIGVLMGGLFGSFLALAIIADPEQSQDIVRWTTGSIQSATWPRLHILVVALLVALPLVVPAVSAGNLLLLGDDVAHGAGLNVGRARLLLLVAAAALTAPAVSLVGGISFVGFVAPHLVRRTTGNDLRRQLPAAALAGALLVAVADFASRNLKPYELAQRLGWDSLLNPTPLPTGAYLALFGLPVFFYMLRYAR